MAARALYTDTIAALSSPPPAHSPAHEHTSEHTVLSRAIVRLSGPRALEFAESVFTGTHPLRQPQHADPPRAWRRIAGRVRWHTHALPAAAYVMRAPRSYTREDMIELHVPGLAWVVSSILDTLLAAGARMAQPGEFTRRAFEHGRITLAQAEAVAALIHSTTADEARVFAGRLQARAHQDREALRQDIEELLGLVELGLDFSQEDVVVVAPDELRTRLERLHSRAEALSASAPAGSEEQEGSAVLNGGLPRIVLAGPTNAGKSSLFNALLKRNAAIVSAQRHTTRDAVESMLTLAGASGKHAARLADTAGCGGDEPQASGDAPSRWLQAAAWSATESAVRSADILLIVLECVPPTAAARHLRRMLEAARPGAQALLWTKTDRKAPSANELEAAAKTLGLQAPRVFAVSSRTGAGCEALTAFLARQTGEISTRTRAAHFAADTAAREARRRAAAALRQARDAFARGDGEDVLAVELREALHALSAEEGARLRHDTLTERLLDQIFSQFCIGK